MQRKNPGMRVPFSWSADGTVKYIGNESLNTTDCTKLNTSDAKIITNNGIIKSAEGDILLIIKESCS